MTRKAERYYIEQDCGYETPCWVWLLATNHHGYGLLRDSGRTRIAHRVYYEREKGQVPVGLQLDHLCRNRACVNPAHLEPVTNKENSMRGLRPKLTWDDVSEIKVLIQRGYLQREIAAKFNVTQVTISLISLGRTWRE